LLKTLFPSGAVEYRQQNISVINMALHKSLCTFA